MVSVKGRGHHLFVPFFGGPDGKMAVRLVLQLAENPEVTATIVHFRDPRNESVASTQGSVVVEQTVVETKNGQPQRQEDDTAFFASMQRSLATELEGRVVFDSSARGSPLSDALATAQEEVGQDPKNGGDLIVLGRHLPTASSADAYNGCLGPATDKILESGIRASVLVVQARRNGSD